MGYTHSLYPNPYRPPCPEPPLLPQPHPLHHYTLQRLREGSWTGSHTHQDLRLAHPRVQERDGHGDGDRGRWPAWKHGLESGLEGQNAERETGARTGLGGTARAQEEGKGMVGGQAYQNGLHLLLHKVLALNRGILLPTGEGPSHAGSHLRIDMGHCSVDAPWNGLAG